MIFWANHNFVNSLYFILYFFVYNTQKKDFRFSFSEYISVLKTRFEILLFIQYNLSCLNGSSPSINITFSLSIWKFCNVNQQ